ncbi:MULTISPECIES: hypothetical protein [Vibrio]|uniref:hypothetical protein n=1 Tax=Vibrio TaxID=662 RepID=UPI00078D8932|nr:MULTISPECIES: hypothetical protein [Vibrio]BAU70908.1 hypothetical protein [Vibrio sp. 04Ya108]BBM67835.1 hypothetical protein VA249_44810 [Vibrio alfacsensis]BCN27005.1 hypothetical protein VYA_41970 [Vibrio alfacsensis]
MKLLLSLIQYILLTIGNSYLSIRANHTAAFFIGLAARTGDTRASYLLGISIVAGNHTGIYPFDDGVAMIRQAAKGGYEKARLWLVQYSPLITDVDKRDRFSIRCQEISDIQEREAPGYLMRNLNYLSTTFIILFSGIFIISSLITWVRIFVNALGIIFVNALGIS